MKVINRGTVTVEFTLQELSLVADCLYEFNMKNWVVPGYPPNLLYDLLQEMKQFQLPLEK